jgi:hypothetical protein
MFSIGGVEGRRGIGAGGVMWCHCTVGWFLPGTWRVLGSGWRWGVLESLEVEVRV